MTADPLGWLGARAQWVLAFGVVAALAVPGPGALLDGTIAFWVTLLYGLSMTRIDLGAVARRAVGPRRMARNLGVIALLTVAMPAAFWAVGSAAGLPPEHLEALVYTAAAPPLGSAAAFCLILGFDAAFALEITVVASLIAPVTLPAVARALLGEAVPLETLALTGRLAAMIALGSLAAMLARRLFGAERIARNAVRLDGLSALLLVVFLFPLFHRLPETIGAAPAFAAGTLALVIVANLGTQIALFPLLRRMAGYATGGAGALIAGNRNAALTLAALPPDPAFTLYVALYQVPMYLTPLIMRRVTRAAARGALES